MKDGKFGKLKIKFIVGSFDKEVERSGFRSCRRYTKRVAEMNEAAESLDRYDDFASLTLAPSDYAQTDGEYGIPKKEFHYGKERLLKHQIQATRAFLGELRGFGLLADVVGSGKTYEACSVLSELAAKGKITSVLIIAPAQVYSTWINVLELNFGLGKNVLKDGGSRLDNKLLKRGEDSLYRPTVPIIVKTEDFVKWDEADIEDVLFDVVIVDEAHKLCAEEGENARALKLLSVMMETKKRANKTYCVLLSATPHSGNLEQMFRLWYFIRCKGGNPDDFDEKDDSARSDAYRREKEYYKSHICRGASTVMEFIRNVKMTEVLEKYKTEFYEYLEDAGIKDYNHMLDGEWKKAVDDFLNPDVNTFTEINKLAEIINKVHDSIAKAYHNGVLRSIMIRQPNDRIRKRKNIENVFFFPACKKGPVETVGLNGENITFDATATGREIKFRGEEYSVAEYVNKFRGNESYARVYARLLFGDGVLYAYGLKDTDFEKKDSIKYYESQIARRSAKGVDNGGETIRFIPVYDKDVITAKYSELRVILSRHKSERIILFFDYNAAVTETCEEKILSLLKEDAEFSQRIILGDKRSVGETEKKFNDKSDAILVVTNSAFTEGANLQKSNVIVNFQVTPNPLAMEQSIGRIFRLGQENDVTIYSLADMTKLEGYVLMYYARIGLMTSNSGDAAIIAGSNNDNMVTIRCDGCGKVKLMSKDDFETYKKNNSDVIYCDDTDKCRQNDEKRTLMTEINEYEMKCDRCGVVFKRQEAKLNGQYGCLSISNTAKGVMCNSGDKDVRQYYCRKICAISHCHKFTHGSMKGKCEALNAYLKGSNVSDQELMTLCADCPYQDKCGKCRVGVGVNAVKSCFDCEEATCTPHPHVITFNDKWEAPCPVCKEEGAHGVLKPIVARTFETYIRSAYEYKQDGGASFCKNLLSESKKVAIIQEILSNDKVGN